MGGAKLSREPCMSCSAVLSRNAPATLRLVRSLALAPAGLSVWQFKNPLKDQNFIAKTLSRPPRRLRRDGHRNGFRASERGRNTEAAEQPRHRGSPESMVHVGLGVGAAHHSTPDLRFQRLGARPHQWNGRNGSKLEIENNALRELSNAKLRSQQLLAADG